ncbi:hypothetical protein [Cohnella lupini]|uniref:Uncharacterized protein n=1 Tax=Cohnella lupini TaxID=1294267 RepID=A0A3D9IA32_9BACL|nr:hypothetical protein [Cohnella lupini]RED58036.1 hypothetical protein DFP95_10972 [Cohnella lupini]
MESKTNKKKWITLLLTATMSVTLLFGATACNDNNNDGTDVVVEDNTPDVDVVVPDTGSESPSPSASSAE